MNCQTITSDFDTFYHDLRATRSYADAIAASASGRLDRCKAPSRLEGGALRWGSRTTFADQCAGQHRWHRCLDIEHDLVAGWRALDRARRGLTPRGDAFGVNLSRSFMLDGAARFIEALERDLEEFKADWTGPTHLVCLELSEVEHPQEWELAALEGADGW